MICFQPQLCEYKMNKTFMLQVVAEYTEGSMLIVVDSMQDFISKFKEYHTQKMAFMLEQVPDYHAGITSGNWGTVCDKRMAMEKQFIGSNNNAPFDFEFSTGCCYIKHGKGAGQFYENH